MKSLDDWLEDLDAGPIECLRDFRTWCERMEHLRQENSYFAVVLMTEFMIKAEQHETLKATLYTDPVFAADARGPRVFSASVGRFVLRVSDITDANAYEKARSYGKAAEHFMEAEVEPAEVVAQLKRQGGVKKFLKAVKDAKAEADAEAKEVAADKADTEDADDEAMDDADDELSNEADELVEASPRPEPSGTADDNAGQRNTGSNSKVQPKRTREARGKIVAAVLTQEPKKVIKPAFNYKEMLMVGGPEHLRRRVTSTPFGEKVTVVLQCSRWKPGVEHRELTIVSVDE